MKSDWEALSWNLHLPKLYIFDATSTIDRMQAGGRFSSRKDVTTLAVLDSPDLENQLDALLKKTALFGRVVFQTHGISGTIYFGSDPVTAYHVTNNYAKYSRLFPFYTRIYFDGCEVGRGKAGTEFLRAVGNILLSMGGGETFAFEDGGAPIPGSWFLIGGHTYHQTPVKRLYFRPGGVEYFPPPQPDISVMAASTAWS
jgi:hypothetical protein